jgi:hypothetical protein
MRLKKDEILNRLADQGNVAQFIAFRPDGREPVQSFSRLAGLPANTAFATPRDAVAALLDRAPEGSVNIRSYEPDNPRSREFLYGLSDAEQILRSLTRLTNDGLHTIINETVDIADGGVSGVAQGGTIEFAPDDTPRCVEKPGTASLPFELGIRLLRTVYGFAPELQASDARIEFSVHPRRRGTRGGHTLLWEYEEGAGAPPPPALIWPNRFSRHIGDKAYGLLIAHLLGQGVPLTTVIGRRVAPFSFGTETGSAEIWIRTCPAEPEPGLFTTTRGWIDPFALLQAEDPEQQRIASVLAQRAVPAFYAGAALTGPDGLVVEGAPGEGDLFMLGVRPPGALPADIRQALEASNEALVAQLGPIRFEWVHDGVHAWIVQLHRGATGSGGRVIVPGEAERWILFDVADGLEALRDFTRSLGVGCGIELLGEVGLTSHIADIVRRAAIPTRIRVTL